MRAVALAVAVIGAVLFSRRKSLKGDTERAKSAASDGARSLNDRVRHRSAGPPADEEDASAIEDEEDTSALQDEEDASAVQDEGVDQVEASSEDEVPTDSD